MPKLEQPTHSTQNSPWRQVVEKPVDAFVGYIDQKYPRVTPNEISALGLGGVAACSLLYENFPDWKFPIAIGTTAACLADLVDGALKRKKDPTGTLLPDGAIPDVFCDRNVDYMISLNLSNAARQKGSWFGVFINDLAAWTSIFPSVARSRAETNNIIVDERKARTTRLVIGITAMAFADKPLVPEVAGLAMTTLNLKSAYQRYRAIEAGSPYAVDTLDDPEKLAGAKRKYTFLKLQTLAETALTAGIIKGNYKIFKSSRKK